MDFKTITSDGTLKGTKVLNYMGMPAHSMVRRIRIDIDSTRALEQAVVYIETIMLNPDDTPRVEGSDVIVQVTTRKLVDLNLTMG